eukprot:1389705-Alexandrium_andersonii.AAC.1
MRGMFTSWKTSVGELDKAIQGWKAANEQSEKDAQRAKAAAQAKQGATSSTPKRKKTNNASILE